MAWANKPNAIIHAELLEGQFTLGQIHAYYEANPWPRWMLHPEQPPHPSLDDLQRSVGVGDHILIAVDQDREIWGVRINGSDSASPGKHLLLRREEASLSTDDPLTPNARQSLRHLSALSWAMAGGPPPEPVIPRGNAEVETLIDHHALYLAALETYRSLYDPQFGS